MLLRNMLTGKRTMIDFDATIAKAETFDSVSDARKWVITIIGELVDLWETPGGELLARRLLNRIVEPFKRKGKGEFLREIVGYIKEEINKRQQEKFDAATGHDNRETFDTEEDGTVVASQQNIVKILSGNKFIAFNYESFTERKIFRFTNGDLWNNGLEKDRIEITYPKEHAVTGNKTNRWYYVSGHLPELKLYLHQFFPDERRWYELDDAIDVVCKRNQFNLYQDWMDNGLPEWDGVERFDFLYRHAGVSDKKWSITLGKLIVLGMVARCYQPGFDFRGNVILEGEENIGKSWLVKSLAFDYRFATTYEFTKNGGEYEAARQLKGMPIVELADKGGIDNRSSDQIKSFLTKTHDTNRRMHSDDVEHIQRLSIFVITCNESGAYLKGDATGGTRFYPVRCNGIIDVEAIISELPQLYAQAKQMWLSGITPRPTEEDMILQRQYIASRQIKPNYYYYALDVLKLHRNQIGTEWDQGFTMDEMMSWIENEPWFVLKPKKYHRDEMRKVLPVYFSIQSDVKKVPVAYQEQYKVDTLRKWRYTPKDQTPWNEFLDSLED